MSQEPSHDARGLAAVDCALDLIRHLPPGYAKGGRERFEAALAPLLEPLDALCERHLPEARVPSPCGHSRYFAAGRPWVNLLGCFDLCGRCRRNAVRALRLVREAIVDGKPSERFVESS